VPLRREQQLRAVSNKRVLSDPALGAIIPQPQIVCVSGGCRLQSCAFLRSFDRTTRFLFRFCHVSLLVAMRCVTTVLIVPNNMRFRSLVYCTLDH
jgi:hypothetical protein